MRKRPAYKLLQPGDPWTIILPSPMLVDFEDGAGERPAEPGDLIGKWFSTDEPGRDFRVVRVTPERAPPGVIPASIAYELVFIDFQHFAVRG